MIKPKFIKYIFLILSFIFIFVWIFDIKFNTNENSEKKWSDIVFILDVSKSMNVYDINDWNINYSRLDVSKKIISDYIIKNSNNNYSLVIFAWESTSILPLTNDLDVFLTFLKQVDYKNLSKQWSNFKDAIYLAKERLKNSKNSKVAIMLTDWWEKWDLEKINIVPEKDTKYFVVWVWTEKWWKIIEAKDLFWDYIFKTYNWQEVISSLNKENIDNLWKYLNWNILYISSISDIKDFFNKTKSISDLWSFFSINWIYEKSSWRIFWAISFIFFSIFLLFYFFDDIFINYFYKLWKKHF